MGVSEISDELEEAVAKLEGYHRDALEWFAKYQGQVVPWSAFNDPDFRLASSPKGIYKPKQIQYALSVKQTLGSPYSDSAPEPHEEGGWLYRYHQESLAGKDPLLMHTNLALQRCRRDDVPVGVIIQVSRKPAPVLYRVWGLALVRYWLDGIFMLEGQNLDEVYSLSLHREHQSRRVAELTEVSPIESSVTIDVNDA